MRVIALTGEAERCEQFIAVLTREHKMATLRRERGNARTFAQTGSSEELLCVKSPTRYTLTRYAQENPDQISSELDNLGEREDVDFAVVVGGSSRHGLFHLVQFTRSSWSALHTLNRIFEALKTVPEWMTLGALVRTVRSHPDFNKAGAILTFTGTVREEAFALEFDIYEREAQQRLSSIVRDLKTA